MSRKDINYFVGVQGKRGEEMSRKMMDVEGKEQSSMNRSHVPCACIDGLKKIGTIKEI